MSLAAIDAAWPDTGRRTSLIKAAADSRSHTLDARILKALEDPDPQVAAAAKQAAKTLKLDRSKRDKTPKIGSLPPAKALAQVIEAKGDTALGEQIFTRATCVACHTVSQDEPQKARILATSPRPTSARIWPPASSSQTSRSPRDSPAMSSLTKMARS